MKKLFICFISLFAIYNVDAQEFQFLEETHDFDTIPEGPQVSTIFRFRNIGDQALIISGARGSCGCTQPTFTNRQIAPGDTGSIQVTYNTQGRPNAFSKTVFVNSNAKLTEGQTEKILIIKGFVDSAMKIENYKPSPIPDFEEIKKDMPKKPKKEKKIKRGKMNGKLKE